MNTQPLFSEAATMSHAPINSRRISPPPLLHAQRRPEYAEHFSDATPSTPNKESRAASRRRHATHASSRISPTYDAMFYYAASDTVISEPITPVSAGATPPAWRYRQ